LETGAVVAVTVQGANEGDTATSVETLIEAAEQIETLVPEGEGIKEVVADKGYHSNQELVGLEAVGVRSYISEPDRGRRNWKNHPRRARPSTGIVDGFAACTDLGRGSATYLCIARIARRSSLTKPFLPRGC
jgi:hypothetical protein